MIGRKIGAMFFLFLIVILASCHVAPQSLTIGLIPVRDADEMEQSFEDIRAFLEEKLDMPVEVSIAEDYVSLVEGMKNDEIDIGWYGAFSYIAAESQMELEPLIAGQRKGDIYYNSLIITHKDSGITSIEDLEGKRFAFVDSGSTSGFVMPFALFKSRNIDIEQYFSEYYYAGSHDKVPTDLIKNKVDAGAISSIQYNYLIDDGTINKDDFVIIHHSENIPGSPFVARADIDKTVKEEFTKAMLTLHEEIPEKMLQFDNDIEKYLKIDSNQYNSIRNIATILGKEYMYSFFLKNE